MEDINKIFNEQPDERLWERLEEKLEAKAGLRKLRYYKIGSLAAMIVALVAAVAYFDHILDDHNPHLFASNEDYSSFVLEELDDNESGLFNMVFFDEIRKAYDKALQPEVLTLAGDYKSRDGEISFVITLKEYQYHLDFGINSFPTFSLWKVNGQTLYFETKDGKMLKMNTEPYGLRLIESSLFPEYSNFEFLKLAII